MNTKALKSKRALYGIHQEEIAKKLGISSVSYSKKETGKVEFKRNEIEEISKILNLSIEEVGEIFFNDNLPTRQ